MATKKDEQTGYKEIFIPESTDDSALHNKYFSVNGKVYTVPVGISVMVPEEVAAAWEESKAQAKKARAAILAAQGNREEYNKVFMG